MSWLGTLAAKTETLLNKVDQAAGQALSKESSVASDDGPTSSPWQPPQKLLDISSKSYSPFLSAEKQKSASPTTVEDSRKQWTTRNSVGYNTSSRRNDSKMQNDSVIGIEASSGSFTFKSTSGGKDADDELFEFLNKQTDSESMVKKDLNSSRPSSSLSNLSSHSSRKTPDQPHIAVADGNLQDYASVEEIERQNQPTLEIENEMLKNEIKSLNQEMESAIRRIQSTQDELNQMQKKLDRQFSQLSKGEEIVRELQSRESDMLEALNVKDSQLSLLRTRLDEADRELETTKKRVSNLQTKRDCIYKDHSLSTNVQGHALDTLQDKLNEAETALRNQQEMCQRTQEELTSRQTKLESDKQTLIAEVSSLQKHLNTDRATNADLSSHLKSSRLNAETAKNELIEYKDKATRILQSKDRLITSLKDGSSGGGVGETMVLASELDSMRQERDILHEELQNSQLAVENLRAELGELENQMQQDNETSRENIMSLEEQIQQEKKRREESEFEIHKIKQELRFFHEEFIKEKSGFQSRFQDRENEVARLRNQLTTKSTNVTCEEELENRLHSLTESLIQKQTTLETLSTEKNSLLLQLERFKKQYHEAEASAIRATSAAAAAINITDDDDARQRVGNGFMNESPFDGKVTRRVKLAANSIDRFSIRLGLFLRRYPIARIFIIVYMGLLHLWVMIVLLTYQPEVHTSLDLPHL